MALDLNYKPNVLVDTSTLSENEWLSWRKKGIGGSDVAAALGLSPYRTKRELYYDTGFFDCYVYCYLRDGF